MEWMEKVFVKEIEPLHNEYSCVALILHGSKTHASLEIVTRCRALGVHIVLLPRHLTDVVQPLDGAIFGPLKRALTKLEKKTPAPAEWATLHPLGLCSIFHFSLCVSRRGLQHSGTVP